MNSWKQVWVLLKFQNAASTYVWITPIALSLPLYIMFMTPDRQLDFLLYNSNLIVLPILTATYVLTPEKLSLRYRGVGFGTGTEFMLTRAVDKALFCRAKALLFFGVCLLGPLLSFLWALEHRDLHIMEYSKISQHNIIFLFPGAISLGGHYQQHMLIPYGRVWVALWQIGVLLFVAAMTQFIVWLTFSLKHRRAFLWAFFFLVILAPFAFILTFHHASMRADWPSLGEAFFFAFVAHPFLYGVLLIIALITGQLWCERRFVRLEF